MAHTHLTESRPGMGMGFYILCCTVHTALTNYLLLCWSRSLSRSRSHAVWISYMYYCTLRAFPCRTSVYRSTSGCSTLWVLHWSWREFSVDAIMSVPAIPTSNLVKNTSLCLNETQSSELWAPQKNFSPKWLAHVANNLYNNPTSCLELCFHN